MISPDIEQTLKKQGLIGVAGGVQIDLNIATQSLENGLYKDAHSCDHDCTTNNGGGYDCPAAFSVNKRLDTKHSLPKNNIARALDVASNGVLRTNRRILDSGLFAAYCYQNRIPDNVAYFYKKTLQGQEIEFNLFGNPEMYLPVNELVSETAAKGHRVNVTTTGRKIMKDQNFRREFKNSGANLLAMSYDFSSPDEVRALGLMDSEQILAEEKKYRNSPGKKSGQRFKVFESAYVAKLAQEEGGFPPILVNLVLHDGNAHQGKEIIQALKEGFGGIGVNPYPGQDGYDFTKPKPIERNEEKTKSLSGFIGWAIDQHTTAETNSIIPRLHYWLMLKAAVETYSGDWTKIADTLAGTDLWNCFEHAGTGRYVQLGGSFLPRSQKDMQGPYLNCYWNSNTIDQNEIPVQRMRPKDVSAYVLGGSTEIASGKILPCRGCGMPRLVFDIISMEMGMDEAIKPAYFRLRKQILGF